MSASRWCKSGRFDGWQGLLVLCAYGLVHIWVCSRASFGEACIDGREASIAVEVLKASGPLGWAVSHSPILVTYEPAMLNTPGLLAWVWICKDWGWGGGCNVIVHEMTGTKPPGQSISLHCQPETVKFLSGFTVKAEKKKEKKKLPE